MHTILLLTICCVVVCYTASDDAENRGLIIGIPLAVLIILILLVVIFIVIRVMSTRRSGLNILKYPPPPCE